MSWILIHPGRYHLYHSSLDSEVLLHIPLNHTPFPPLDSWGELDHATRFGEVFAKTRRRPAREPHDSGGGAETSTLAVRNPYKPPGT